MFSPTVCFAVNACSLLWSAWNIAGIRYAESRSSAQERPPYFRALADGFLETRRNILLRNVILIGLTWGLVGGGYYILIPFLGGSVHGMGGLGIGILYGIDGIGIILGA